MRSKLGSSVTVSVFGRFFAAILRLHNAIELMPLSSAYVLFTETIPRKNAYVNIYRIVDAIYWKSLKICRFHSNGSWNPVR